MIKCRYCDNEVECNTCVLNKHEIDGCICIECFLKYYVEYNKDSVFHLNRLYYYINYGCWNLINKKELDSILVSLLL